MSDLKEIGEPKSEPKFPALIPGEGLHVLHLFYKIEHGQWQLFDAIEKRAQLTRFTQLVQEIRETEQTQLLIFSMVSPKADIGFMLLANDLQVANAFEKRLTQSLGADVLTPVFSYYSLTESSEYSTTDEEYAASLTTNSDGEKLAPDSPEFEKAMEEFRARMAKYRKDKLTPNLPVWPVFCFYPMSKRRGETQNWYALSHEERKRLMAGHGKLGRRWHGKILQLITGSTGLDDMEWGVTLFARDTFDIKDIVYQMRFDPVSVRYAEFGEFYIGISLPLDELFRRLVL